MLEAGLRKFDPRTARDLLLRREEIRRTILLAPVTELPSLFPDLGIVAGGAARTVGHLEPLLAPIEEALLRRRRVRLVSSAAIQHAKTTSVIFAMGRAIARDPSLRIAWVTYTTERAIFRSKQVRDVVNFFDVELSTDQQGGSFWTTEAGGMFVAGGVDKGLTGLDYDVTFFDDPYPDRPAVESLPFREKVEDLITLMDGRSKSLVINHARWSIDDSIGVKVAARDKQLQADPRDKPKWDYVNLPAIAEADLFDSLARPPGTLLWPEFKDKKYFDSLEVTPFEWASQYQGRPRAKGDAIFKPARTYSKLPTTGLRFAIGLDTASTEKKSADFSACVLMAACQRPTTTDERERGWAKVVTEYYVLDVARAQLEAPDFAEQCLMPMSRRNPTARIHSFMYGNEKAIAQQVNKEIERAERAAREKALPGQQVYLRRVEYEQGHGDKLARAQAFARDWNRGLVFVPEDAPWAVAFTRELESFTGVRDKRDDQVDSGVSAHHLLDRGSVVETYVPGQQRPTSLLDDYAGSSGARFDDGRGY